MRSLGLSLVLLFGISCASDPGPQPLPQPLPTSSGTTQASAQPVPKADPSLPPRNAFFGNPDRIAPQLSPDGKHLAFLAPVEGVMNVWVGPANDPSKAKPVTKETKRGLRQYFWTFTADQLVYAQDEGGDENFHLFAVDVTKGSVTDLTPIAGVRAQLVGRSYKVPGKLLVGLNDRDKRHHDVYEIDVKTAQRKLVFKNEEGYEPTSDLDLKVRVATKMQPDASVDLVTVGPDGKTKPLAKIPTEDAMGTGVLDFDKSGKVLRLLDSRGRDKSALVNLDPQKGTVTVVHDPAKADVSETLVHPTERTIQAVASNYERREWTFLDKTVEADFAALAKADRGDVQVVSRTLDDKTWVVAYLRADGPVRYHLFDKKTQKATFLFSASSSLEKLKLVQMHPRVIPSRDGLSLVSYLTLPAGSDPDADGKPDKPLPLVLVVHGGPWARDAWGYNPTHQWLASRGYAVLSTNYRGSTGFGKKFVNAADKEWAAKMHDDLLDATAWATKNGVAKADAVAIYGGSYGGYSALVGLTFTPKDFACAVDIVGPSNLVTLLENVPPYWAPFLPMLTSKLADPKTEAGKTWLLSRSPLSKVDQIQRPLLIGQGANDPRVKQVESDQIVKAMQARNIPVTYVLYPDEGHGFVRPENRKSFNAVAEAFLAQCLGGPYEPAGEDFKGASISVPAGAEHVVGLKEALGAKTP
jgi:dipeptidyl aminopeptidase/acylaminoacyl peptidase